MENVFIKERTKFKTVMKTNNLNDFIGFEKILFIE